MGLVPALAQAEAALTVWYYRHDDTAMEIFSVLSTAVSQAERI